MQAVKKGMVINMVYDINLIPKARKSTSQKNRLVWMVVVLLFAVLLSFFGFYLPIQTKLALIDEIGNQEKELLDYSTVNEEYTMLTARLEDIKRTEVMLKQLKDNSLLITDLLTDLEDCIPKDITIQSLALDEGMITLDGSSPDYEKIAQYIVNIRNIDRVIGVSFLSAATDQEIIDDGTATDDSKILYNFTLYVKLDVIDILPVLVASQMEEQNAAVQEVAE